MQSLSSALCIDILILVYWIFNQSIKSLSYKSSIGSEVDRYATIPAQGKYVGKLWVKQWLTLDVKIYIIRIRTYFIKYMSEIFNRQ